MSTALLRSTTLREAHRQWVSRPADERFPSLGALRAAVERRAHASRALPLPAKSLTVTATDTTLTLATADEAVVPTHWAFGQLAGEISAPAEYLRALPAPLAGACLAHGLARADADWLCLVTEPSDEDDASPRTLRAVTSPKYGRIWDVDVVRMVEALVAATHAQFYNPREWGGAPSGLYASDHDVFCFLIDGGSLVDGGSPRDRLHRGFYVWNSEVGAATFGIATFLFREVCGNHLIFGAEDVHTLKIRHTARAPQRFVTDAVPLLEAYVHASPRPLEAQIRRAKDFLLPAAPAELLTWVGDRGFSKTEAKAAVTKATAEEGDCRTLWQLVNGVTAAAREYAYTDRRVALERKAGGLLALAA